MAKKKPEKVVEGSQPAAGECEVVVRGPKGEMLLAAVVAAPPDQVANVVRVALVLAERHLWT